MSIWKTPITLEDVNQLYKGTMVDHLGIVFTDISEDALAATMPVDHRTLQPYGIMHGGASAALAESIGSIAANFSVDQKTSRCVGLDINTSHIKSVKDGFVTGIARPVHLGKSTHVWEIKIFNEKDLLVSQSRLTMLVLQKEI